MRPGACSDITYWIGSPETCGSESVDGSEAGSEPETSRRWAGTPPT